MATFLLWNLSVSDVEFTELRKPFQYSGLRLWGHHIKDFYPEFFPEANWGHEAHKAQVSCVLYSSDSYINMLMLSPERPAPGWSQGGFKGGNPWALSLIANHLTTESEHNWTLFWTLRWQSP